MYSLSGYGKMIADSRRMDAYVGALQQAIKPDSVVVDIGTGTGIFALLACQLGVRKVYAIEPSNWVEVARELAKENGYSDRIEFIQTLSTGATLAERADVIISDLRGILPLFGQHIPAIIDARSRFLKPDGVLIPLRDRLFATLVEQTPELDKFYTSPWEEQPMGCNLQSARRFIRNTWQKANLSASQCLVQPICCLTLDYATIERPNFSAELNWTLQQSGVACGLALWFDATLAENVEFSNAPGQPELIYGQAFVPWLTPLPLKCGDRVSVKLQANLVGREYVWRWHSRVFDGENLTQPKANFEQSTFASQPLSLASLRKRANDFIPKLNSDGEIAQFILKLMGEGRSVGEIARALTHEYSSAFPNLSSALRHAGEFSQKYSL
ncbi:MAG: 50S ribosomal protein L11 methyltransferase [Cyanobacteriota bacterium]|nr:50S ribosomal protein L11 methyltransferase [Cyanobacteriota bacterium]